MNSFGQILRLTTFGESHGPAIGGVLDGVPAGFTIDPEAIREALDRRRPGGSAAGSRRKEQDKVQLLSGLFEGKTLGSPIGFIIPNTDARSQDYEMLKDTFRPNHADYTYEVKYGIRDYRGGGRASARETACRVCAGAIAEQILSKFHIEICAYTSSIGSCSFSPQGKVSASDVYASPVRCPDPSVSQRMEELLQGVREAADTIGGTVTCRISGVPPGLGEPLFGKLQAALSAAMMSIPAAKGFEYGLGFTAASACGSEVIDQFVPGAPIAIKGNFSGGIQGGISNGNDIVFRVAFKPAPTLLRPVETTDRNGQSITLEMHGRHDPCVVPRAVAVVQAMTALVMLDSLLLHRASLLRHDIEA